MKTTNWVFLLALLLLIGTASPLAASLPDSPPDSWLGTQPLSESGDHENVQHLATLPLFWSFTLDIALHDDIACIATGWSGLRLVNISDPDNPQEVGQLITGGYVRQLIVDDDIVWAAQGNAGLVAIDISDPANPHEIGRFDNDSYFFSVAKLEDLLCVATSFGLIILDGNDPSSPSLITDFMMDFMEIPREIVLTNNHAFVTNPSDEIVVLDLSDPSIPIEVGSTHTGSETPTLLHIEGNLLYANVRGVGLRTYTITTPSRPQLSTTLPRPGGGVITGVLVDDGLLYIGTSYGYLEILDNSNPLQPDQISLQSLVPLSAFALTGEHLFLASNSYGLGVANVADVDSPEMSAIYNRAGGIRDLAILGGFTYLANNSGDMALVDISQPDALEFIRWIDHPDHLLGTRIAGEHLFALSETDEHELWVYSLEEPSQPTLETEYPLEYSDFDFEVINDLLIVATYGATPGLTIISIANPTDPVEIGHYIQTDIRSRSLAVQDSFVYIGTDLMGGTNIFSIEDPENPELRGNIPNLGTAEDIVVYGEIAFIAQRYGDGQVIYNIDHPESAFYIGQWSDLEAAYDVEIEGNYLLAAMGWEGVHVFDISNPEEPVEAGYFDTFGFAEGLYLDGTLLYVDDSMSYTVLDLSQLLGTTYPPEPFSLVSPEDGFDFANDGGEPLQFEWEASSDIDPFDQVSYTLQVATEPLFSEPINFETGTATNVSVSELPLSECYWRVVAEDRFGNETLSTETRVLNVYLGVGEDAGSHPYEFGLTSIQPNPFNARTTIQFMLREPGIATLELYNILGQSEAILQNGWLNAGLYTASLNTESMALASGVYFLKLESNGNLATRKLVLLK